MRATLGATVVGSLVALSCRAPREPSTCEEVGVVIEAAGPAERYVLGEAAPYPAEADLASSFESLATSQRLRRRAAWAAVARVLASTPLAVEVPASESSLPTFRTWYDRDDLNRVFQRAFAGLGPARRASRSPFDEHELDRAFAWNAGAVLELEGWSAERLAERVSALHEPRSIAALGGIRRVLVSPAAARHVVASYAEILACLERGSPPAFENDPPVVRRSHTVFVSLPRCHARRAGPYFVASSGGVVVRWEGFNSLGTTVALLRGPEAPVMERECSTATARSCEASGPGTFWVEVHAGGAPADGRLRIDVDSPDPAPRCLRGPFPTASATVAMHWVRADLGVPMPTFDTSARSLRRRLDHGETAWGEGDGSADPGPGRIHTMTLPDGPTYRLAAFHLRTRELPHWLNVTLWWSDQPDTDFGEDRPAEIRALGSPWDHYKMCVAVDFEERDPDPGGGLWDEAPSLAAALAEMYGRHSWCSNPYIDAAPGLFESNCIGCHQHALSGRAPGAVVEESRSLEHAGRGASRIDAPADGFWSIDAGDDYGSVLRDVVDWWAAAEGRP